MEKHNRTGELFTHRAINRTRYKTKKREYSGTGVPCWHSPDGETTFSLKAEFAGIFLPVLFPSPQSPPSPPLRSGNSDVDQPGIIYPPPPPHSAGQAVWGS